MRNYPFHVYFIFAKQQVGIITNVVNTATVNTGSEAVTTSAATGGASGVNAVPTGQGSTGRPAHRLSMREAG